MRKLRLEGFSCILLFLLLVSCAAHGRLIAEILPENGLKHPLELYTDEIGRYEIRIKNAGNDGINNLVVKIVTSGNLAIINGFEETTQAVFNLGPVHAGEEKSLLIKAKPVFKLKGEGVGNVLSIYYGDGEYTQFIGTYVKEVRAPISVKANLNKYVMTKNEENMVEVELENTSASEHIENVSISLQLQDKLVAKEQSQKIEFLNPGELIRKGFSFTATPEAKGTQYLALVVDFVDSKGRHTIEKNFKLEIQDVRISTVAILAIVIGLIVLYLVMKRNEGRQKT